MVGYVSEKFYDIKLWEEIYVNGEMVLEQMIEPECTTQCCMRESLNMEMENRMRNAEKMSVELKKENELYKGFLKRMGTQFEDLFYEYVKMEANNGR